MLPVLSFGGLVVPVQPLFMLLASLIGIELGARAMGRVSEETHRQEWQSAFYNSAFIAFLGGLVAARLGYAVRYYATYLDAPALLLSIRPGTLAFWPGLLAALAIGLLLLKRRRIPASRIADSVAIGSAAFLVVISLGTFLTGDRYGTLSDVPWAVELWGAFRHPVQLYEAIAMMGILFWLWRQAPHAMPGKIFWFFIMLYSTSLLFLEAFHATTPVMFEGVRTLQVSALVSLTAALYVLSFYVPPHFQADDESVTYIYPYDLM